jgi:hypothetical protein
MRRNIAIAIVTLAAVAALWAFQDQRVAADDAPPEADKRVALIYFKGRSADHAFTLEKVSLSERYGMKVLRGVHADTGEEEDWMKGREALVAVDAVESLTYYESLEDYQRAIADFADDTL